MVCSGSSRQPALPHGVPDRRQVVFRPGSLDDGSLKRGMQVSLAAEDHFGFGLEVPEERCRRELGPGRDLLNRGLLEALLGEQVKGGILYGPPGLPLLERSSPGSGS